VRWPLFGLLYQPRMMDDDDDECGALGGLSGKGNEQLGENGPQSCSVHHTYDILFDQGSNPDCCGSKPATGNIFLRNVGSYKSHTV
jgi:hypothetical protein